MNYTLWWLYSACFAMDSFYYAWLHHQANANTFSSLSINTLINEHWASQVALVVKNPPANSRDARDMGSIPGLGRCPGGGNGNPLLYACLENSMDRGAWWATVHGAPKTQTRLSAHTHTQHLNLLICEKPQVLYSVGTPVTSARVRVRFTDISFVQNMVWIT